MGLLSGSGGLLDLLIAHLPRAPRNSARASSKYVTDARGSGPMPAWKRIDAIQEVLPACDQGRAEAEGGLISLEDYEGLVRAGKG